MSTAGHQTLKTKQAIIGGTLAGEKAMRLIGACLPESCNMSPFSTHLAGRPVCLVALPCLPPPLDTADTSQHMHEFMVPWPVQQPTSWKEWRKRTFSPNRAILVDCGE